jgi:hypothetical protein
MTESKSVNDDAQLEAEADAMGAQAAKAADFADSALGQLRRLQTRSKLLKKVLKEELQR